MTPVPQSEISRAQFELIGKLSFENAILKGDLDRLNGVVTQLQNELQKAQGELGLRDAADKAKIAAAVTTETPTAG